MEDLKNKEKDNKDNEWLRHLMSQRSTVTPNPVHSNRKIPVHQYVSNRQQRGIRNG